MADEKLRAGGIRIVASAPWKARRDVCGLSLNSALIWWPGPPVPQRRLLGFVLGQRIAALNHEALDDAVETGAVVKTLVRQFLEILDVAGRDVRPEFEDHFALGGFDDWQLRS